MAIKVEAFKMWCTDMTAVVIVAFAELLYRFRISVQQAWLVTFPGSTGS